MNELFHVLYPEERYVTAAQLIEWAKDDIADGLSDEPEPYTVQEAIGILHDTGTVTVASQFKRRP